MKAVVIVALIVAQFAAQGSAFVAFCDRGRCVAEPTGPGVLNATASESNPAIFNVGLKKGWLRTKMNGGLCAFINNQSEVEMEWCQKNGTYPDWQVNSFLVSVANQSRIAYISTDEKLKVANDVWYLDRINQLTSKLDGDFSTATDGGKNITVYVLDSGVVANSTEFNGKNVLNGTSMVQNPRVKVGHGSAVASLISGSTLGIAKSATVVPIQMIEGTSACLLSRKCRPSTLLNNVKKGLEWAIEDFQQRVKNGTSAPYGVINLSLSAGLLKGCETLFKKARSVGMSVVVASGNDGSNICFLSPYSNTKVITVGATTITDSRAFFTNVGSCVDLYAPGQAVRGVGMNGFDWVSGTSFSSPLVAGGLAVMASRFQTSPNFTVENVEALFLTRYSVTQRLSKSIENKMLHIPPDTWMGRKIMVKNEGLMLKQYRSISPVQCQTICTFSSACASWYFAYTPLELIQAGTLDVGICQVFKNVPGVDQGAGGLEEVLIGDGDIARYEHYAGLKSEKAVKCDPTKPLSDCHQNKVAV